MWHGSLSYSSFHNIFDQPGIYTVVNSLEFQQWKCNFLLEIHLLFLFLSFSPISACPRCKVCPLTFFTKSEMQIHSKSHTEAKPHKCPHCSKSFANASYLAQHLRIHLGIKPYHCSYCENSFRQLSHLQQHTRWVRQMRVPAKGRVEGHLFINTYVNTVWTKNRDV